jgi:hypothetical protein
MIPMTEDEQEAYEERVAIMMEGAALSERDASKMALEAIIASRLAKMDARGQSRELAKGLRNGH